MEITQKNTADLIPYANNARTHAPEQVAQIAASIKEFGWTNPILIADGVIIAGHGRVLAARKLGMGQVPCIDISHMTKAQRRAYVLADNKLAMNAGWDDELLSIELEQIKEDGLLELTGFDLGDLAAATMDEGDPDEVPAEAAGEPVSQRGEVYELGPHRLMCGDSTSAEDWQALMGGERADMCFTSPPYAQQRTYDGGGIGDWDELMHAVFTALPLAETAQVFVNLGLVHRENEWIPYWDGWLAWMRTQGWRRFAWYVWDQGPGMMGDWAGRLAPAHEFIWHFNRTTRKPAKTHVCKLAGEAVGRGMRRPDGEVRALTCAGEAIQSHKIPDSVIRVMRHKGAVTGGDHPAVFPVALPLEFYQAYAEPGMVAVEPFGGSGTCIIAAAKTGRICRAMEISPRYCDVIRKRWTKFAKENNRPVGSGGLE